jgi:hypothetical protein
MYNQKQSTLDVKGGGYLKNMIVSNRAYTAWKVSSSVHII